MKDVISVDSNSKSEDTRSPGFYTPMDIAPGEYSEPPQDTSLDDYLIDLVDEHFPKGKSKERGQANVMLAYFVMWHKAEVANLLQVIEDEVIGSKENYNFDNMERASVIYRNKLRAKQRQILKQIKDNVINGGSL